MRDRGQTITLYLDTARKRGPSRLGRQPVAAENALSVRSKPRGCEQVAGGTAEYAPLRRGLCEATAPRTSQIRRSVGQWVFGEGGLEDVGDRPSGECGSDRRLDFGIDIAQDRSDAI